MGLRQGLLKKGAARWGILFLLLGIALAVATIQPEPVPVEAQQQSNFDYYGYVKYPNGSFMNGTNITVEVVNFNLPSLGPPPVVGIFTNLSDLTGFFNVTNITGGLNYRIKIHLT